MEELIHSTTDRETTLLGYTLAMQTGMDETDRVLNLQVRGGAIDYSDFKGLFVEFHIGRFGVWLRLGKEL